MLSRVAQSPARQLVFTLAAFAFPTMADVSPSDVPVPYEGTMEVESFHEEAMTPQQVGGVVTPPELAALHQIIRQREEAHHKREQQMRAEMAEVRQINMQQQQMMLALQEQMHRMTISQSQLVATMSKPAAPTPPAQPAPVSLVSLVQSGQSFFQRARASDTMYPDTLAEWEAAAAPLLDATRKSLTQAELLRLVFGIAAAKLNLDEPQMKVLSLCYRMCCKSREIVSSQYFEMIDRLLTTAPEEFELFWREMEIERAPAKSQPFRAAGWQRAPAPRRASTERAPAPTESSESKGTKAPAKVKREPRS